MEIFLLDKFVDLKKGVVLFGHCFELWRIFYWTSFRMDANFVSPFH